jgi:hypothetical protein
LEELEADMVGDDLLFSEHFAAAQSMQSAWTRMASTFGCMMIHLTRQTLTIKPHWFAAWPISLLHLDLHHEIPIARIGRVRQVGKWAAYGKVEVHFQAANGTDRTLLLFMKRSPEFVDKVSSATHQ